MECLLGVRAEGLLNTTSPSPRSPGEASRSTAEGAAGAGGGGVGVEAARGGGAAPSIDVDILPVWLDSVSVPLEAYSSKRQVNKPVKQTLKK